MILWKISVDESSLGKKLSCGTKSVIVKYFQGTGQFLLEEKEYKRQVKEGKQGWRPNQFSAATGHDSSRPCPLCHSSWHRNALSSLSPQWHKDFLLWVKCHSWVSVLEWFADTLSKCWMPRGALRDFLKSNAELVFCNTKPQTCRFMCLYHIRSGVVFFLSLTMSQSKPIFHALLLNYKI